MPKASTWHLGKELPGIMLVNSPLKVFDTIILGLNLCGHSSTFPAQKYNPRTHIGSASRNIFGCPSGSICMRVVFP